MRVRVSFVCDGGILGTNIKHHMINFTIPTRPIEGTLLREKYSMSCKKRHVYTKEVSCLGKPVNMTCDGTFNGNVTVNCTEVKSPSCSNNAFGRSGIDSTSCHVVSSNDTYLKCALLFHL